MIAYYAERTFSGNGIDICSDAFGDPADPAVLLIMRAGSSLLLWEERFCHRLGECGRVMPPTSPLLESHFSLESGGYCTCFPCQLPGML